MLNNILKQPADTRFLINYYGEENSQILRGENNEENNDMILPDDRNDVNGDDSEHAGIHKMIVFFSTHRESEFEIDPSYK